MGQSYRKGDPRREARISRREVRRKANNFQVARTVAVRVDPESLRKIGV